jgi:SAM-dependent methyltransferase
VTDLETRAFDNAYEGTPTWEIGEPQTAVVRAVRLGRIRGDVLDIGCGTGVHARMLAGGGHVVVGIDFSRRAIELARTGPPSTAEFAVADARALALAGYGPEGRTFDTVLDVGCFHTIQPADREGFAASVRGALRPNGHLVLVCWSDRNPFGFGPNRISPAEIRATFGAGWEVEAIEESTLDTRMPQGTVLAWVAVIRRS